MDQFGSVIGAGTREAEWLESIVVDSIEFQHTNPKTGKAEQLFCVLAAWGYPAGSKNGRLWALRAHPSDTAADWVDYLRSLPGTPRSVISYADQAIGTAMRTDWGPDGPAHHEHHLYRNALKALQKDDVRFGTATCSVHHWPTRSPASKVGRPSVTSPCLAGTRPRSGGRATGTSA